ncbi:hypothetical protein [Pedobacter miscanthi]|uniref:Uncharacterized protein n=1 Tax=Pedobacter miscanthi TaxID=2259170 RepID=A0A366KMN6_9SPHI|nr:hypothetical protein [Pedobacter miscanthi]RBQ02936.1 hypothetical protein DRW42_24430 [Pedobacter miscanthi]
MKKISIKNIIDFCQKSDKAKKRFATDLNLKEEKKNTDGGGDYWISCISTISNAYKGNSPYLINDKIADLEEKLEATDYKRTKAMYQRNIDVLYRFEDFDIEKWKPVGNIKYLKKQKRDTIIKIKGLFIQATPHHVFTYKNGDVNEIGAIWFIAKLNGFEKDELGMFADILNRYLSTHYNDGYIINPEYCLAVDVIKGIEVSYEQVQKAGVPTLLTRTIEEIKMLM